MCKIINKELKTQEVSSLLSQIEQWGWRMKEKGRKCPKQNSIIVLLDVIFENIVQDIIRGRRRQKNPKEESLPVTNSEWRR